MSNTGSRSFGELLREYRVAAGLTQERLAERARMSRAAVAKLEQGTRQRPYPATIALLAEALSLTSNDRLDLERAAHRGTAAVVVAEENVKPPAGLPIHFSTFVGRDREVAHVCKMIEAQRLVTLVGAGGVGKTRLAVHAAERLSSANGRGNHYDGIWFSDLAVVNDRQMAIGAIGRSVGMEQCTTFDMLVRYLQAQRFLLIMDNCEHLIDEIAESISELLRRCANGQILATSREPLHIDGERVYRVPTLSFPSADTDAALSLSEALDFSAIRLFADRAEAADSDFQLTESIIAPVAEICRRLDGIALAIELAAARTSALSAATLAQRLGEHFLRFTHGMHGSLSRHKTMGAVFDWSYALLDETERQVFRRLSIFVGGFTLDLAIALYTDDFEAHLIVESLASLVDKSLVHCDATSEPTRYTMLEPARYYARERLREHGEENRTARAHANALLALAQHFDSSFELTPNSVWDAYIERERDNFHAAFEWSLGPNGDAELGQWLAGSRTAVRCGFASGIVQKWTNSALKTCKETTPLEVQAKLALTAAASALMFEPNLEATLVVSRRALALQQSGDLRAVARAQQLLGATLNKMGRLDEAENILREARATARACRAQTEYFFSTELLATARFSKGDSREARELIAEALEQSRAAGAYRERAHATVALAEIEFASGSAEQAICLIEEAGLSFRAHGSLARLPITLSNLAAYLIALRRCEEARCHALEALGYARTTGATAVIPWAIQHLAAVALFSTDRAKDNTCASLRRAANLVGFVDEMLTRTGRWRGYTEQQEYDKMIASFLGVFEEDEFAKLMDEGRAWSEDDAVAEALALSEK